MILIDIKKKHEIVLWGVFLLATVAFGQLAFAEEKPQAKVKPPLLSKQKVSATKKIEETVPSKSIPKAIDADLDLVSDVDLQKVMEQALQKTMADEAKGYYATTQAITVNAVDDTLIFELDYEQPPDSKEPLRYQMVLKKDKMLAEIDFQSTLIAQSENKVLEGDKKLVDLITLIPNESMSTQLGQGAKIFFVKKIQFNLMMPVRWKSSQKAGKIKIEIKPYRADDEDLEKDKIQKDLLFQAPAPVSVEQILGQSYANERQYERVVANGGEVALLDVLEARPVSTAKLPAMTSYHQGISEEAVRQDMLARYPQFGSLPYWKEHLSGVFTNTSQFLKRSRNQSFFGETQPGFAVLFDRKGAADVQLGYSYQREMPFFYGRLHRISRLAPMDGLVSHDIAGGVVFHPHRRWVYSIQNKLSINRSENLGSPKKFGDRLTSYNYEAGHSLQYNLARGYVQLGSGVRWQTEEVGVDEDVKGYLSAIWFRPLTKKLASRIEYNHTYNFLHDPKPVLNLHVHTMRFGVDYQPLENVTLSPSVRWEIVDRQPYAGLVGGLNYEHKLSSRDSITASYSTDIVHSTSQNFGSESLSNNRITVSPSDKIIRHQTISLAYSHLFSKKLGVVFLGTYGNESDLRVEHSNKYNEYQLSAALNRQFGKDWNLELKYLFTYLDGYQVSLDELGGIARKSDSGNTSQILSLRMLRYFGRAN